MSLLRVHDLAVARGGRCVLQGVGLTIGPGQALILKGSNGIGKTTLLRTIAGLQPPLSGRIVMTEDAAAYSGHADGLKGALSTAENLYFWARVFGRAAQRVTVTAALAAMDLTALADRPAAALSAGQRRRLGLARLMVTARPLWLLDEPTVSLDSPATVLFADMVQAHLAAGGAALIATHTDPGLVAPVLDLTPYRTRSSLPDRPPASFDEVFA